MSGKPDYVIVPKTTVISNPGKNYGVSTKPLKRYVGYVRSWERRVRFGRELPTPWMKEYECRATDEAMAHQLLAKLAYRDGYALGGVQDVQQLED